MRAIALTIYDNPARAAALKILMLAVALLFAGFVSHASAKGVTVRQDAAANIEPGTYSLVAYGCNGANDPRAVAFLQRDKSPYHVSFTQPRAEYRMVSGLTAAEAYRQAEKFVTCNPNVQQAGLSRVQAPDGTLVGYEVTPVFAPLRAGSSEGIITSYHIKGDRVQARVNLDPILQLDQMGGG